MRGQVALVVAVLITGCGVSLVERWEKKAQKDPVGTLLEMADSLNSSSFRRKMSMTPLGPKVSNLFSDVLLSIKYDELSLEDLLKVAEADKAYIRYLYDYGLFDERWETAVFSYREILKAARKKMEKVEDLDSLAEITRYLKPPITARAYKKEYESLVDLYRLRTMEEGEVRWGMSEKDEGRKGDMGGTGVRGYGDIGGRFVLREDPPLRGQERPDNRREGGRCV